LLLKVDLRFLLMPLEQEIWLPIDKEASLEEKTVQGNEFFCADDPELLSSADFALSPIAARLDDCNNIEPG
jgi:hypothetical protein